VADEVRGKLARRVLEREQAADQFRAEPAKTTPEPKSDATRQGTIWRLATAVLWVVSIGAGIAARSVPVGLGTMVGGFVVLQLALFLPPLRKRLLRSGDRPPDAGAGPGR
jgi:hypothetical protein